MNGIITHEKELFRMLRNLKPDLAILTETRADARQTLRRIWPRSKTEQMHPIIGIGGPRGQR